jgi:hypothetical protein
MGAQEGRRMCLCVSIRGECPLCASDQAPRANYSGQQPHNLHTKTICMELHGSTSTSTASTLIRAVVHVSVTWPIQPIHVLQPVLVTVCPPYQRYTLARHRRTDTALSLYLHICTDFSFPVE